jgi:hypothetical protein
MSTIPTVVFNHFFLFSVQLFQFQCQSIVSPPAVCVGSTLVSERDFKLEQGKKNHTYKVIILPFCDSCDTSILFCERDASYYVICDLPGRVVCR